MQLGTDNALLKLSVKLSVMLSVKLSVMAISLSLRNQITDSITKNVMYDYEPAYTCTPSWLLRTIVLM